MSSFRHNIRNDKVVVCNVLAFAPFWCLLIEIDQSVIKDFDLFATEAMTMCHHVVGYLGIV